MRFFMKDKDGSDEPGKELEEIKRGDHCRVNED